jgi:hypothetical protein
MSDFLTRLAQRQLGLAARIEPRVPALHAWVVDRAPVLDPDPDFEHSRVGALQHDAASSALPGHAPVDIKPLTVEVSSTAAPGPWPSASQEPRHQLERRPNVEKESGQATRSAVSAALSADRKPDGGPRRPGTEGQAQAEPGTEALFAMPRRAAGEEGSAPETNSLVQRQTAQPIIAPQPLSGLQNPGRQARRTIAFAAPSMESAASPVQVTIGRIEVTALQSAAPAKRAPAPRKQGISLEDYLARRRRSEP